jgi:hypothetical protein
MLTCHHGCGTNAENPPPEVMMAPVAREQTTSGM